MTYSTFCGNVAYRMSIRTTERRGQAAFNTLHEQRPDLAELIRATGIDPFYDDSKLTDFYNYVERNW